MALKNATPIAAAIAAGPAAKRRTGLAAVMKVSRHDRCRERDGRREHQQQQVDEHRRPGGAREVVQHVMVADPDDRDHKEADHIGGGRRPPAGQLVRERAAARHWHLKSSTSSVTATARTPSLNASSRSATTAAPDPQSPLQGHCGPGPAAHCQHGPLTGGEGLHRPRARAPRRQAAAPGSPSQRSPTASSSKLARRSHITVAMPRRARPACVACGPGRRRRGQACNRLATGPH
jgi:hypothetical protein